MLKLKTPPTTIIIYSGTGGNRPNLLGKVRVKVL